MKVGAPWNGPSPSHGVDDDGNDCLDCCCSWMSCPAPHHLVASFPSFIPEPITLLGTCNPGCGAAALHRFRDLGVESLGMRASGGGDLQNKLHRAWHSASCSQPLGATLGCVTEVPGGRDLAHGSRHLLAVRGGCGRLLPLRRHRALHPQPHAQGHSLLRVHGLVPEAGADHDGHARGERLREAVLAAVRQEEVHAGLQHVHLRQDGQAEGVRRGPERPQRVGLRAQRHQQERPVLRPVRPEGVEDAAPGRLAEFPSGQAPALAASRHGARLPTEVRAVAGDHRAHAREDHPPARLARLLQQGQRISPLPDAMLPLPLRLRLLPLLLSALRLELVLVPCGPASALLVQQWANCHEPDTCIVVRLRQLRRHRVLQVRACRHQGEGAVRDALHLAHGLEA
mmetsp:Transcript_1783/g.5634  ORF Transcript_1783/g.5634 Transcript_1783/m.5634 type:complete len:398 (+) Transcript_1783:142-1335(+)